MSAGRTLGTDRALRAGQPRYTLRTLRARRTLSAGDALSTLRSGQPGNTLRALRAGSALSANYALRTSRAVIALRAL